jgi:hypothetical protein
MPVPRYLDLQSQDISMEERISKEMKRRIESDGVDSHSTTKILRAKIKNQHKKEWYAPHAQAPTNLDDPDLDMDEYSCVLAFYWSTMENIPMCRPSVGPPWRIFLI